MKVTDELVKANITEFRQRFQSLPDRVKSLVEKSKEANAFSLNYPTQIIWVRLKKPNIECFVVLHKSTSDDMKIITLEDIVLEKLSPTLLQGSASELIDSSEARKISSSIKREIVDIEKELGSEWADAIISSDTLSGDLGILLFNLRMAKDTFFLTSSFDMLMRSQLRDSLIEKQRKIIDATLKELIKDVAEVEAAESRTKILETTEKLQSQIKDVYKQQAELREDVFGLRRIVGGKTFGEWKSLLSEVDAINARINALSDIRSTYDKILAQQSDFMKQQTEVMKQQASFVTWIKYAAIFVPVAVLFTPVVNALIQHFLGAG